MIPGRVIFGAVSCWLLAGGLLLPPRELEGADKSSGGPEAEAPDTDSSPSLFARLLDDPTLDGHLHLAYQLNYTARIYQFKGYDVPFKVTNAAAAAQDREQADLLKERHKDVSDQDLNQYFSLRLDPLAVEGSAAKFIQMAGGDISFRYFKDLDGSPAGEEARDGFDHFHDRELLQLQTLNTRLDTLDRHLELVLGRQYGRESEWLHFDGGTATLKGLALWNREAEISAFAGSRVTFYPNSSSSLDGLYGGSFKLWVLDATRLKLSEVYYVDSSFEAELRQDIGTLGWAALTYRQINEDPHSVLVESSLEWLERSLSLYFLYVGKVGAHADDFNFDYTQSARRRRDGDKDMFFNIGDIAPYDEVTLELRKGFWDHYGVLAGGTLHRLRERDAEDNYNTDWQEAWIGFDVNEPFWKGLSGRGTVRYVHTDLPRRLFRLNVDDAIENGVPDFQPEDITGDGEPSHIGVELQIDQDFRRVVGVGATAVFNAYDYQNNFANFSGLTASSVGAYVRWRQFSYLQWFLGYTYDTDYQFVNPDFDALHTVKLQALFKW